MTFTQQQQQSFPENEGHGAPPPPPQQPTSMATQFMPPPQYFFASPAPSSSSSSCSFSKALDISKVALHALYFIFLTIVFVLYIGACLLDLYLTIRNGYPELAWIYSIGISYYFGPALYVGNGIYLALLLILFLISRCLKKPEIVVINQGDYSVLQSGQSFSDQVFLENNETAVNNRPECFKFMAFIAVAWWILFGVIFSITLGCILVSATKYNRHDFYSVVLVYAMAFSGYALILVLMFLYPLALIAAVCSFFEIRRSQNNRAMNPIQPMSDFHSVSQPECTQI